MYHIIYIRLMSLRLYRVTQKNHKVDLIVFDLCSELLLTAQVACQEFMDI